MPEEAVSLVAELSKQASLFVPRQHDALVRVVLAPELHRNDERVCETLLSFCCSLVSANAQFGADIVRKLVHSLLPPLSSPAGEALLNRNDDANVLLRVRSALARVMWLVPSLTRTVLTTIVGCIPHKRLDKRTHLLYMRSVFKLLECDFAEPIRDGVLLGFVDRLLEVDVEIRWEDFADVQEEEHDGLDEGVFDFEKECQRQQSHHHAGVANRSGTGQADGFSEGTKIPVDEAADKMDSLMQETLEHISRRERAGARKRVFSTLMQAFNATVLHTYKSKFTQFLIFHVCSLDSSGELGALFAQHVRERIYERSEAVNTRMAAAAYLSSFLARANFVPHETVLENLGQLVHFCHGFVHSDAHQLSPWSNERPVFEACFQAVLYVLCYRADAILNAGGDNAMQLKQLPLSELLRHKISPLRACMPAVVSEFAKRADALNDCATGTEVLQLAGSNAASAAASSLPELHVERSENRRTLDSFFPFDPYLLRESAKQMRLDQSYIRWEARHDEDDDDEDEEEEDDDESDEEDEAAEEEREHESDGEREAMEQDDGNQRQHVTRNASIKVQKQQQQPQPTNPAANMATENLWGTSPSSGSHPGGMSIDNDDGGNQQMLGLMKPEHQHAIPSPV